MVADVIASIVPFLAAGILLIAALAVRFAGMNRILNIVDYARVNDIEELHRWAGNRLLLLPLVSVAIGALSQRNPALAIPLIIVLVMAVMGMVMWIAAGSGKFSRT